MKNKFIKFDDKYCYTIFISLYILLFGVILFFYHEEILINLFIVLCIPLVMSYSWGVKFNYKKKLISFYTPLDFKCTKIKMCDIKTLTFNEITKQRKNHYYFGFFESGRFMNVFSPNHVYNNGKVYVFIVKTKDENEYRINYSLLYKARSKRRVFKQESKINQIISEFNTYKYKIFFNSN